MPIIPRWLPWILGGALLVGLAVAMRGCSEERTQRLALTANLAGAGENLKALELALKHKDRRIASLEERIASFTCEGDLTITYGPDGGIIERRCIGKASDDLHVTRSASGSEITPLLPPPFVPIQPSAVRCQRWMLGPAWTFSSAGFASGGLCGAVRLGPFWFPAILSFDTRTLKPSVVLAIAWGR